MPILFEITKVEAYSGFKAEQSPRAFVYKGQKKKVIEILDQWHEGGMDSRRPVITYFKTLTSEGEEYILRYNQTRDCWAIKTC